MTHRSLGNERKINFLSMSNDFIFENFLSKKTSSFPVFFGDNKNPRKHIILNQQYSELFSLAK